MKALSWLQAAPAWLASMWCRNELAIAREKGKAIFVVRVKPMAEGPLIPAIQEVDLTLDRETALVKLAKGLKEHGLDPTSTFDWKPGRPIYPGLAAFDIDDAAIFFGREDFPGYQRGQNESKKRMHPAALPRQIRLDKCTQITHQHFVADPEHDRRVVVVSFHVRSKAACAEIPREKPVAGAVRTTRKFLAGYVLHNLKG